MWFSTRSFSSAPGRTSVVRILPIPLGSLVLDHRMVLVSVGLRPEVLNAIRASAILQGNQMVEFIVVRSVREPVGLHRLPLDFVGNGRRGPDRCRGP